MIMVTPYLRIANYFPQIMQNYTQNQTFPRYDYFLGQALNSKVIISSITVWEISMLIEKDRISLTMDIENWVKEVEAIEGVRFMPVDNEIAIKSTKLPGEFHKDPSDRIIVATARKLAVPLVTIDKKIITYPHVQTVW